MLKVKKVDALEAFSFNELETYINDYIAINSRHIVMDIKYNVTEMDISPEHLEEDGPTREVRYSALILIGEEI